MPITDLTMIIYCYGLDFQIYQCQKLIPHVDEKTIIEWYSILRGICSTALINNPVQLGTGVDSIVVEIDESLFGRKRKYNRGRGNQHYWVFGMLERGTKKSVMRLVSDRKRDTLLQIIQRYVAPGTTIYSDQWAAYSTLANEGYHHATVNHSVEFVREDGCCTNAIEGLWGLAKLRIKKMKGIRTDKLPDVLDEFMYRYRFGKPNGDVFYRLLQDISSNTIY